MYTIPVLFVTYNRLSYSQAALASIMDYPGAPVEVTIWDNHSTEVGFQNWLEVSAMYYSNKVKEVIYSPNNVGLAPAINYFFKQYPNAKYVAKVDNDTVLPDNWLANLIDAMKYIQASSGTINKIGAVSGTCLRPTGPTFAQWVRESMTTIPYGEDRLHFNSYVLGTGVLINMDMIRQRGLLFEKFPKSPTEPDKPCLISGWTAYTREAYEYEDWKFAFYSKVPVKLLNLKAEHVLSNDYPEYDAEVQKVRDEGNAWWTSVGGLDGVRKYVREHGGLESLLSKLAPEAQAYFTEQMTKKPQGLQQIDSKMLTECNDVQERSTKQYWEKRVADNGTTRSTFLETPQSRINEFTAIHMEYLRHYVAGKSVLDVGVGWGRMSLPVAHMAKSYVGVDFIPALIDKAKESLPELDFRLEDAKHLSFADETFDVAIAITCLSSFAGAFEETLKEMKRVVKRNGLVLFLEERFIRIDWNLESI